MSDDLLHPLMSTPLGKADFCSRSFEGTPYDEDKLGIKCTEVIYLREHIKELEDALKEANALLMECPASEKWSDENMHLMWPPENTYKE